MNNEIVKQEHKELTAPSFFTDEQIETIKNMYCKGTSPDEFKVFLYTCQRTGLCPFSKQIYCVKRSNQMTIQTGIDGYRLVADRSGKYAPGSEPTFTYDTHGKLLSATSYIKKLTRDGTWHVVSATAYYDEYVQMFNGKPSGLWQKMPRTMLSKCSESLAIRKSFPSELSGIYTKEEMDQTDTVEVASSVEVNPVEYITKDQVEELTKIISECDPEKMDAIDEFIRKKCNGKDINFLKKECYATLKDLFLDRRDKYQADRMRAIMRSEEEVCDEGN
jgi:phage recombination protein Bet